MAWGLATYSGPEITKTLTPNFNGSLNQSQNNDEFAGGAFLKYMLPFLT